MFCRFCGKQIQDDSDYCSYCGKKQDAQKLTMHQHKHAHSFNIDIRTLETIASIVFYIGISVFLLLLFKMAPGIGSERVLSYISIAAITILFSVIIQKIRDKKSTKSRQVLAILFGMVLLMPSLTLRIIYEAKIDSVAADIPSTGTVCVRVKLDEEFYSYLYAGTVSGPYSYVVINGKKYDNAEEFQIDIGKEYNIQIGAGYAARNNITSSSESGISTDTIVLSPDNLRNGYTITRKVNLNGCYANVTVKFIRVCTFWEVISA